MDINPWIFIMAVLAYIIYMVIKLIILYFDPFSELNANLNMFRKNPWVLLMIFIIHAVVQLIIFYFK